MTSQSPALKPRMSHRRPTKLDRFWFGVCYYPEHWDEATRARDPERMRAAGIRVVRMAEFAWDLIEPSEGTFDFTLFDETIALLGQHGISTIMCTPTATPPRWLTREHPDTLRVDSDGRAQVHGSRQHCCHLSPTLRRYSRSITEKMARHYRGNPDVVGWQTDNEIHCHFAECHCESCQRFFREWLRNKYREVARLNRTWGAQFWSQSYGSFDEVQTPRPNKPTHLNPAHQLDYFRFLSDGAARFQHDQVEILRATNPSWFVTHNGMMSHLDYGGPFTEDLDFIGYDSYPMFTFTHGERLRENAYWLDRARAWSGNFIVPEHQSGPGGQPPYFHDTPEPGEVRLLSYSALAHGADSLLYFRWRSCLFGAEQYWCGVLDHDDVPRRRYDEVSQVGREMAVVGDELLGTSVHVEAAVAASDFDAEEAHFTYSLGLPRPAELASNVHAELWERGYAVGCVHPADDLSGVKLYVIPHYALFDPRWVPGLTRYVEAGGTLVVGARSATRNVDNNIVPETLPGCLRELCGVVVEEYGKLNDAPGRELELETDAGRVGAQHWYEVLSPEGGSNAVARWQGRAHLAGKVAVTRRELGRGHVYYVGSYLTRPLFGALLPELLQSSGLLPLWSDLPAGVSVMRRDGQGKRLWFFLNGGSAAVTLPRTPAGLELLTHKASAGALELGAY
ncbi:MAG TPA: beta-galactosidase, partial [Polyangiaceae bacterium]|nr:beta-galactosidase [Polyangiaceae bacterium]